MGDSFLDLRGFLGYFGIGGLVPFGGKEAMLKALAANDVIVMDKGVTLVRLSVFCSQFGILGRSRPALRWLRDAGVPIVHLPGGIYYNHDTLMEAITELTARGMPDLYGPCASTGPHERVVTPPNGSGAKLLALRQLAGQCATIQEVRRAMKNVSTETDGRGHLTLSRRKGKRKGSAA